MNSRTSPSAEDPVTTDAVVAADGRTIQGRFFTPPQAARAAVLIVPAIGTAQDFYAPLAAWLARRGVLTATFDYRGTGRSRPERLRAFDADLMDWARLDCGAMINAVTERAPELPLVWIGHSLGGQLLPFVPNGARVNRMVTVASGTGYWRDHSAWARRRVWWLWYVVVPLTLPLFGYFPGRRLRKVGDVPRGVMAQWRRWCLHPEYAVGVEGDAARASFAAVRAPIVSISFEDDRIMSARNTAALHALYTGAPVTYERLDPPADGRRIGHFGFFRPTAEPLWRAHLLPAIDPAGFGETPES